MKHFKLEEFACRCCGSNGTLQAMGNTKALVEAVLDPAREAYGKPIYVNSGYRCQKHNAEVGGASASQHLRGEAADLRCDDNRKLAKLIVEQGRFDQLIIYQNFVHVSYKKNGVNRHQVLRKTANGYERVNLDCLIL